MLQIGGAALATATVRSSDAMLTSAALSENYVSSPDLPMYTQCIYNLTGDIVLSVAPSVGDVRDRWSIRCGTCIVHEEAALSCTPDTERYSTLPELSEGPDTVS